MKLNKKDYAVAIVFLMLNILLKTINLSDSPFWYDEMISVKNSLLDFGHIKHESEWDNNPPFYYYCLWVWLKLFPTTEFSSRMLSVLFIAIGIGLTYLFVKKNQSEKVAIWTVIFLTISNFIFYYAQETRAYSLVFLLSIISSMLFFKVIVRKSYPSILSLAFVNFLLVYTHYISGLILLGQILFILLYHKKILLKVISVEVILIGLLVFLRFTKKQFLLIIGFGENKDFWLQKSTIHDLWAALSKF